MSPLKRTGILVGAVALILLVCASFYLWYQTLVAGDPTFFESDIAAFERSDEIQQPPTKAIVFVGSSSIRFWDTLREDMAPLVVIQRGFGGAHMEHVVHNARRIVTPYAPRAVVVFVGGNDIGSGKSVAMVTEDYENFLHIMRTDLPDTDIWLLSMKPSKLRWDKWSEMTQVDDVMRAFAQRDSRIYFVETGRTLLAADGMPDDVYVFDGLHLNAEGYRRWTQLLKPQLMAMYGEH